MFNKETMCVLNDILVFFSYQYIFIFEFIFPEFGKLREFPVVDASMDLLVKETQVFVGTSEKNKSY